MTESERREKAAARKRAVCARELSLERETRLAARRFQEVQERLEESQENAKERIATRATVERARLERESSWIERQGLPPGVSNMSNSDRKNCMKQEQNDMQGM